MNKEQKEEFKFILDELYKLGWPDIGYSINGSFIVIPENIPNLITDTYYLILNKTTNDVKENDLLLKLDFIEYDKINNFPLFKIPNKDFVFRVNSKLTLINQVDEMNYSIGEFINDSGYSIVHNYRNHIDYYSTVEQTKNYYSFCEIKD